MFLLTPMPEEPQPTEIRQINERAEKTNKRAFSTFRGSLNQDDQ